MKRIPLSLLFCFSLFPTTSSADTAPVITPKWTITAGVESPESVYLDSASGLLFVSQMGAGGGTTKDGDGWISKLSTEGKIIANKWVTGLDSPKGLRSHNGVLWVADIDKVISIQITTGKVLSTTTVPEATFLNDVAIGADGTVYVSDTLKGRIIAVKDGKSSVFLSGPAMEHPNGLLVRDGTLLVAGWGLEVADDFTTKTPGRLLSVDLKTRKLTPVSAKPLGNLDGLESDGKDGYLVTDWFAGTLFHVSAAGHATTLATFPEGAADIAWLPGQKLLILPEMKENRISAIEIHSDLLPAP